MTDRTTIKSALESMLFVWGEPLDAKTAALVDKGAVELADDKYLAQAVEMIERMGK